LGIFTTVLSEREAANALHFERLCGQRVLGSAKTGSD
jgi:hypothetical protein